MFTNFKEIQPVNINEYLPKILKLQDDVYQYLLSQGKANLFFKSSKEEIVEYIVSNNSLVTVLETKDRILSVCYFTFNHTPYNDLTLYIKNSQIYKDYIFSTNGSNDLLTPYIEHLYSYIGLKNRGVVNSELLDLIREKVKNNDFFENDSLRQKISVYLVIYEILSDPLYPWLTSNNVMPLEKNLQKIAKEFDEFISYFQYTYINSPTILDPKMISLNDHNVGELDTYFSAPDFRNKGYASNLINFSIEKALERNNISAISATVHPDNSISKHILENLGFLNFCTVERRKGVPRDVMFKLL